MARLRVLTSRRVAPTLATAALLLLLSPAAAAAGPSTCGAGGSASQCEARVLGLVHRLASTQRRIEGKVSTLRTLEKLRSGILAGRRIELDSAERQHLEPHNRIVSEASYDSRHRPISTDVERFFRRPRTVAMHLQVEHHALVPLSLPKSEVAGPALLAMVDRMAELALYDLEGRPLLDGFDLGHEAGAVVERLLVSTQQDPPLVLTTDNTSRIRVHAVKVEPTSARSAAADALAAAAAGEGNESNKSDVGHLGAATVTAAPPKLQCAFKLPPAPRGGEVRRLTAMLIVEHGGQTHFVAGDSAGGVTVFSHRGFLRGRVRITDDDGGVRGLVKAEENSVLFFSRHTFGTVLLPLVDMVQPPCRGPASPIVHATIDRKYSPTRVFLSLEDGDVVVYNTLQGTSQACDLALKFPHVSVMPMRLHPFRGYVLGVPEPYGGDEEASSELLFFSVAAMESGYGIAPSRSLLLQAAFAASGPAQVSVLPFAEGDASPLALSFAAARGVQLFDVRMRKAARPKVALKEAVREGSSWFSLFAKIAVLVIVALAAPIWYWRRRRAAAAQATAAAADAAAATAAGPAFAAGVAGAPAAKGKAAPAAAKAKQASAPPAAAREQLRQRHGQPSASSSSSSSAAAASSQIRSQREAAAASSQSRDQPRPKVEEVFDDDDDDEEDPGYGAPYDEGAAGLGLGRDDPYER